MRLRGINGKKEKENSQSYENQRGKDMVTSSFPRKERHKLSTDGIFQSFLEKKCLNFRQ